MNTIAMASQKPSQKLNPLTLLAWVVSRQINGCLRISNEVASWSIYLEHGKLTYASNSVDPFKRLDRHLRSLNTQLSTLESEATIQMGLLFEVPLGNYSSDNRDYQAICWLIKQRYLTVEQAIALVEELAKEVIASFLLVKEGTIELIEKDKIENFPKLCRLDLRPLIKASYQLNQDLKQLEPSISTVTKTPPASSQNGNHNGTVKFSEAIAEPRPSSASSSVGAIATPPSEPSTQATYKIVCIDDSPAVLNAIKSFLDDEIFSVITISNPLSALMQIVRNKPDLILLDIGMPNLDGYELCSLLRRHPSFKETPIVMVTGNTGFVDRAKAKLVRASGYLTKPFTRSDLLKMIFKFLT